MPLSQSRLFFLGPYERLEGAGQGVSLTSMQYVLIEERCVSCLALKRQQEKRTGERRVQRGPLVWIPGPREEGKVLDGVRLSGTDSRPLNEFKCS